MSEFLSLGGYAVRRKAICKDAETLPTTYPMIVQSSIAES
jgi:hypothetical protein